jgi:putative intracellular protease/amidase
LKVRFRRPRLLAAAAAVLVLPGVGAVLLLGLPAARVRSLRPVVIDAVEHARTIAALKPPKRARPVVAVLGENRGTETTDYVVPYAVLRQSGVAEVLALATRPGPLKLMPALAIQPQATTAEFDARHPEGADFVIVPAMHHADDDAVVDWIRAEAAKGATIVGVCSGAKILGHAGLLDGRAATAHWYDVAGLRKKYPTMRWVRDRRYVADRGVVTTTGVTASVPVSLAIVEAIGGRDLAAAVAREIGAGDWQAGHDSDAFRFERQHFWTAAGNALAFWDRETVGIPVETGVDEIALALTADAYSRTYRSRAVALATAGGPVLTRRGLQLLPDPSADGLAMMLPPVSRTAPVRTLDGVLDGIARSYGRPTASFVALQLEYPWTSR